MLRQSGGGVVTCAGQKVVLIPATDYAVERIKTLYRNEDGGYVPSFRLKDIIIDNTPPSYFEHTIEKRCDAQGFFKFANLADGTFYVSTGIFWSAPTILQGGALVQRVKVSNGEEREIVLSAP